MVKATLTLLLLACLAWAVTCRAETETALHQAATLEKALREESVAAKNRLSSPEWTTRFADLRAAARTLDVTSATAVVRQIEVLDLPDATRTLCHELLDEMRKERSARNLAFTRRVDAAIKKARQACRDAKGEGELNPTQHELTAFQNELKREPGEPKIEGLATRVQWTAEAVGTWQDVLALRAKGFEKEATARGESATSFVEGEEDFEGPRNVVATMNRDGSGDVSWENLPGTEGDITIRYRDRNGQWATLAVAPAGSTSFHIPTDYKPPRPKADPRPQPTPPNGPAEQKASGAEAEQTPADSGKKPAD